MIKIRQPVRYGSELKDIEFAQFPELSDTVKTVLDFPVGVQTAVKDRGIASGKFLRSGIAGNLSIAKVNSFKNVEELYHEFPAGDTFHDFVFSQKVYIVLAVRGLDFNMADAHYYDSTHTIFLADIGSTDSVTLFVVGTTFSIKGSRAPDGTCNIRLYGFY